MNFFTKILIFCIAFSFSFAFEIPQNAHNIEIACMFESKRLQSEWTKQDWDMLVTNALNSDVSWQNSAKTYCLLYDELLNQ